MFKSTSNPNSGQCGQHMEKSTTLATKVMEQLSAGWRHLSQRKHSGEFKALDFDFQGAFLHTLASSFKTDSIEIKHNMFPFIQCHGFHIILNIDFTTLYLCFRNTWPFFSKPLLNILPFLPKVHKKKSNKLISLLF